MANIFTDAQWRIIKGLQCQICGIENGGATIVVDNSLGDGSADLFGTGSANDPLYAVAGGGGATTIYSGDGTINSNRTVTLDSGVILKFESPVQGSFQIDLQNADPSKVAAFEIRNGGGNSGFRAEVNNSSQYLRLGQFGSKLQGLSGSLDVGFNSGVQLIRGDIAANNYSSLTMAPGVSSPPLWLDVNGIAGISAVRIDGSGAATGVNYSRLETSGSVGGIGTNAKAQLTPTEFTIQRTIGAPPDLAVFTVNVNTGQVKLSTQYQSSAFLNVTSGGILTKVAAMAAIADATDATDVVTKFNTLLAELRTAGLLAP